jgi:hypothetical protein
MRQIQQLDLRAYDRPYLACYSSRDDIVSLDKKKRANERVGRRA